MRLNNKTVHTFNVLIYLNKHHNTYLKLTDISEALDIAYEYLRVIAKDLNKLDVTDSKPGKNGGIRLSKNPQDISIYPILLNTENMSEDAICVTDCRNCPNDSRCHMSTFLQKKTNEFIYSFKDVTLAEMIDENSK